MSDPTLVALVSLVSALFGSGGVYAWFKLSAEKGQIIVSTAQGVVIAQSSVLKDIQEAYDRVAEELAQVKMDSMHREEEYSNCQERIKQMETSIMFLQRSLDRQGQMSILARRKTHVALNFIGSYELLVDNLLTELRDHHVKINPKLRSHDLRVRLQEEMDKIDELEATFAEETVKSEPPIESEGPVH